MIKIINIQEKEKALRELNKFSKRRYDSVDIEFINVHLKNINKICGRKLFDKNSLFVRSSTLWEIMQPVGGKGSHNFHGLKSEDILGALKGAIDPYSVYIARNKRIAVCTLFENFEHEKLLIVIELHCGLESDRFANINKIVSVYPKYNIDNLLLKLDKKEILYIKKENRTGLQ